MTCIVCSRRIEEGRRRGNPPRLTKYCLKCRAERRRRARVKYVWRSEFDAYLKAHYFGGLNRRFQVLNRMIRMTGLPRWYIKKQATRLGLTIRHGSKTLDVEGDRSAREAGRQSVIRDNRKAVAPPRELSRQQAEAPRHLPARARWLHDARPDVLEFIKDHPQEINLGKVDQIWFLDLVLLKGREVREAKSSRDA